MSKSPKIPPNAFDFYTAFKHSLPLLYNYWLVFCKETPNEAAVWLNWKVADKGELFVEIWRSFFRVSPERALMSLCSCSKPDIQQPENVLWQAFFKDPKKKSPRRNAFCRYLKRLSMLEIVAIQANKNKRSMCFE